MTPPTYPISDREWTRLVEQTADLFNNLTLTRGFQYYKQGRVQALEAIAPFQLNAVVAGSQLYRVQLHLEPLASSVCECPVGQACKHIVAVLLSFADEQSRSVHALVNASVAASLPPRSSEAHRAGLKPSLMNQRMSAEELNRMTLDEWQDVFRSRVGASAGRIRQSQDIQSALRAIEDVQPKLSPSAELLFRLNACLYLLNELAAPSTDVRSQSFGSSLGYYTHLAAAELQEAIDACLGQPLDLSNEPDQRARLEETLAHVRSALLLEPEGRSYYADTYHRLWMLWIRPNLSSQVDSAPYEEELRILQSEEVSSDQRQGATSGIKPRSLSRSYYAQSRMLFYLSRDEESLERLQQSQERTREAPRDILSYPAELLREKQSTRLVFWLSALGPLISQYRGYSLAPYAALWERIVQEQPEAEAAMWSTLRSMLPAARHLYLDQLYAAGKWQEWMDFKLSEGTDPLEHRVTELQPLEKQAPAMLLPFYHQAVERYIRNKNRDSYKQAVKMLKRLSKLYKKLQQEPRWEQFIDSFTSRHTRLRALQEELRRGKLIP